MLEADSSGKHGINNSFLPSSSFRSFALLLSFSLPFSLSGIFEFRRFHVTDARRSPEERRADVRRTGTVFVLDARARERIEPRNFFGESSGAPPDVVRRHRRLMPRAVVASLVALVSCPGDRMPIGGWRWRRRREERERGGPRRSREPGWVAGCRRKGSKEDAEGIRNGLRNQMG